MLNREKFNIPIDNENGIIRDSESKALLTTDKKALNLYRMRKSQDQAAQDDINNLKNEVSNIKNMLTEILNKMESK